MADAQVLLICCNARLSWFVRLAILASVVHISSQVSRQRRELTDNVAEQPRIIAQRGNLVFLAAADRNISFSVSGQGSVLIGGNDLKQIADLTQENNRQIVQLKSQPTLTSLQTRIQDIENRLQGGLLPGQGQGQGGSTSQQGLIDITNRLTVLENRLNQLNASLSVNECASNPCNNGGTCFDLYNGFQCHCTSSWTGRMCDIDVNECQTLQGTDLGCQNGATCVNTIGSFMCSCAANWYGSRCTESHDDCSLSSSEALCSHGSCQNVPRVVPGQPSYRCHCDAGWTTNGIQPMCNVDVNECTAGRLPCSTNPPVQCMNVPGSFFCGPCPPGYSGNGFTCIDVDECQVGNGGCSMAPLVTCTNSLGSRICGPCPDGYNGNGVTCTFVGVCGMNNGGCHSLATCQESPGYLGRSCTCPSGYSGDGVGPNGCVSSGYGPCASNPCGANGQCQVISGTMSYRCTCNAGWMGSNCQQQLDPCSSQPCINGGTCQSTGGLSYSCTCTSSYTGSNCQQAQLSCGGTLNGEAGSFSFPPAETSQTYPHSVNCAWVITTLPNKILVLTFPRFKVEYHYDCNYDYLQINDGPSQSSHLIGRFCGQVPPGGGTLNTTHNQVYIMFHSDASISSDGFQVNWISATPSCGGNLLNQEYGTISSPGYPGNYPLNRDCSWAVSVPLGKTMLITFGNIALEHHDNCSYDYLEVRDGLMDYDPVIRRYCSTINPPPVTTSGPYAYIRFHSDELLTDRGFSLSFSALQGCGRAFASDHGVMTSPDYPSSYPDNSYCIFTIAVPPGEVITFNITNIDIEVHVNCLWDFLEVREGLDESGSFVGRFCGNVTPPVYTSTQNNLWIKFQSDISVGGSGFRATWDVACGGIFTATSGELRSPYFPNPYPGNKECIYVIRQTPGTIITLTFIVFDIEATLSNSSVLCIYDFVEVRNGESESSPLIGRYCGSSIPAPIHSTIHSLWIKFKSDSSVHNYGFRAQYETANTGSDVGTPETGSGCGGTLTGPSGAFNSPSFPNVYPHGANCTWYLTAPEGFIIRLSFSSFTLENHMNCRWDYVEVFDNYTTSSSLGRFCGTERPPVLTSSDNVMTVLFVSDASISREGFSASFVSFNASTVCGGELRNPTGMISSPNYPLQYPHNRECEWTIVALAGQQITLNITDFLIEYHRNCQFDYLEIRNGGYSSSPIIGKYCGTQIDRVILSHSNRLYLKFVSDHSVSRRGFQMSYDTAVTGCGGELTSTTGSFTSPNYPASYARNSECFWLITVAHGSRVNLHFVDFNMETHSTCANDYLEIRDTGPHGTQLARLCGSLTVDDVESTSNQMWVKFRSDWWWHGRGFHATYRAVCNNVLTGHYGVIESPNFPRPYPANRDCTWIIESTLGNTVNASFSHFRLQNGNALTCNNDYVEFRDGRTASSPLINRYCGRAVLPPGVATTSQYLYVRFKSDAAISNTGFRLEYIVNGCGGHMTSSTGEFTSLNYPSAYPHDRECIWRITVDPGQRIELTIQDFDVEHHTNCSYDVLEVYGGLDVTSPLLTQLCHSQTTPQVFTTTGNNALVLFISDVMMSGRGFRATYQSVPDGCGGNFTSRNGLIMSKNYPLMYPHFTDCMWEITVEPHGHIILTFLDFDVEGSTNCLYDYVAVYESVNFNSSQLLRACGNSLPSPSVLRSFHNKLFIRMRSDYSISGRGFKASYSTGCGRTLNADVDGQIQSIGWPVSYEMNSDCSWLIQSSNLGNRVTLTFTHLDIESSPNCTNDYIRVLNGNDDDAPVVGTYCGRTLPLPVVSSGSALVVRFVTDALNQRPGFTASYTTSLSACGGDFTAEHGIFSSPSFPDGYPNDIECVWTITSSPGNRVMLSFSYFNLESSSFCNGDFVEVRRNNVTGQVLGRYCGNQLPGNLTVEQKLWIRFRSNNNIQAPGFTATYTTMYGGELIGNTGLISSPLYPASYPSDADYTWIVTVDLDKRVRVTFQAMHIEPSPSCSWDYVKLLDGSTPDSDALGKYCGYALPDPVTASSNQLRVEFHSDDVITDRGFLLSWEAVSGFAVVPTPTPNVPGCGGNLSANSTSMRLESPGFPEGYSTNLDCLWLITADVGNRVSIQFANMSIEHHPSCLFDSVSVYSVMASGARSLIGQFCGSVTPVLPVTSLTNMALVRLRTDHVVNRPGFALDYGTVCGGLIQRSSNGVIKSPGYPGNYPGGSNCTWIFDVLPGRTVRLSFSSFSVSGTAGQCNTGDYVQIFNGGGTSSPLLGQYCGTQSPPVSISSAHQVTVRFVSNGDGQTAGGFQMNYREVQVACGGHVYLNSAVSTTDIASPNYPNNYPVNTDCSWVITAPANKRLQLDFVGAFNIEPHPESCQYDFVELRDGGTVNSPIIGTFCGTSTPSTQTSTGHVMFIRFRSDDSVPRTGFNATVGFARCGGTLNAFNGTMISPNYPSSYPSNTTCEWFVNAPTGHFISFIFDDFRLEYSSNCSTGDYVELRDYNSTGPLLRRACGYYRPPVTNTSDSMAYVRFSSNGPNNQPGFKLKFTASVEVCGGTLTTPVGTLSSPNYPGLYAHSRQCTWSIRVAEGQKVTLTFTDMDLEDPSGNFCYYDFVDVINGLLPLSPYIGRYCGTVIPSPVESSSNTMKVIFRSDGVFSGRGFAASYSSNNPSDCSPAVGNVIQSSGFHLNSTYNVSEMCVWVVNNPSMTSSSIAVRFLTLDLEVHGECAFDFVELREGSDENGQLIGRFCQTDVFLPPVIVTPAQSIWIRFVSDLLFTQRGFQLVYNFTQCGGILNTDFGTVSSPNYPSNYPLNTDCAWRIVAPEGTQIKVTFTALVIGIVNDCSRNYVELFNGGMPSSPSVGRYCQSNLPPIFTSQSNEMRINFHGDAVTSASGFRLTYEFVTAGCGGAIHANQGLISSPNYPRSYNASIECTWDITVTNGYHIVMSFVGQFDLEISNPCTADYVEIFEVRGAGDQTTSLGRYCGNVVPPVINTSGYRARIVFRSDQQNTANGFSLNFTSGCGSTFLDTSGTITSPGYPNNYGHNLDCTYEIGDAQKFTTLRFNTDNFRIEEVDWAWINYAYPNHSYPNTSSFRCMYDWLDIRAVNQASGMEEVLGRFCGTTAPQLLTRLGKMRIRFVTDAYVSDRGWSLDYEVSDCGGNFSQPFGTISTNSHPDNYHLNANCTWIINVPENKVIKLRFEVFDIEPHPQCSWDYVAVYNGLQIDPANQIGRYCGNVVPNQIISNSSSLVINFVSDEYVTAAGFLAQYTSAYGAVHGCGGRINTSSDSIIRSIDMNQDGLYENNLECVWEIVAPADRVVVLQMLNFSVQGYGSYCDDSLQVRDGLFANSPLIGRYCGIRSPWNITATTNFLYVKFTSDDSLSRAGFTARVTTSARVCGGALFANSSAQTLTSPNYPQNYPLNLRCRWVIDAPESEQVEINVTDLALEYHASCRYDYLEFNDYPVSDLSESVTACLMSDIPGELISTGRSYQVNFVTDDAASLRGFSLTYKTASCNRNYTAAAGRVVSPGWPNNYPINTNCEILLSTRPGFKLSIFFAAMDIEPHGQCFYDYLEIYNGTSSNSSSLLTRICGSTIPNPVFIRSNIATIKFVTDNSITRRGYDFTYTASTLGCGGSLKALNGTFASPEYPSRYTDAIVCQWMLKLPAKRKIRLQLYVLPPVAGNVTDICTDSYVRVYNGFATNSPLIGEYCSQDNIAVISSTGKSMRIDFKATNTTAANVAFRAIYWSITTY